MKMNTINEEYNKLLRKLINRLTKKARKNHPIITPNILNNLCDIKNIDYYNKNRSIIFEKLNKVNLFRVVRILNILNYSCHKENKERIYKIRNGKIWISEKGKSYNNDSQYECNYYIFNDIYQNNFIPRLSKIVKDKIIFIPDNVRYTVPQSEKQFIGNLPYGTTITIDKKDNMLFGIHWENLEESNYEDVVDLDLKLINKQETYGWNQSYRSNDKELLFSGDVTNAPKPDGATEVFYIGKNMKDTNFVIDINKFTLNPFEIPFEIIIAKAKEDQLYKNYIIDPNDIIVKLNNSFINKNNEMTLGNLIIKDDCLQISFNVADKGNKGVSNFNNLVDIQNLYYNKYNIYQLYLNDVLYDAGAKIINKNILELIKNITLKEEKDTNLEIKNDIDLSLETLTKESIINLFVEND